VARDAEALAAIVAPGRASAPAPASLFQKLFSAKAVVHGLD
jgi:hypothetical protein